MRAACSRGRRSTLAVAVAACALALASSGCSWIRASTGDYASYRHTRVAPTLDARMAAAGQYLERYPDGAYAEDVRAWLQGAEPAFYASRERSPEGMERYLKALPKGPHAADLRSRLAAIRDLAGRPDPLLVAAKATEARLAAAATSRERANGELAFWLETLADRESYGAPLAEGPAELVMAYSLALPPPACKSVEGGRVCDKDILIPFLVPTPNGLTDRELSFTVSLRMDDAGRPVSARVEGEELFSRVEETYAKRQLTAGGFVDRVDAVARAVEMVSGAFENRVSLEPTCKAPVVAPDILHLECQGMSVRARAGTEPGANDAVTFEPR